MMANWAKEAGQVCGFEVTILDREQIIARGLEALYAVGKGSPYPPALILLEYGKKEPNKPVFGLVGKGVTFDTGGVSLKPSTNMHLMKSDMGGAAAVLGSFMLAARLQLPLRMIGAIAAAENMIDGLAIKPGDVIGSFAGKTIEVVDTDAEGRLVLADAIAYLLKQEKPDVLIDLATLTGSIIRALGYQAGGMFTQNDTLAQALYDAGTQSGERLWRMPLWDEYGTDLKSDVADLRNFTGKPMAESISAAKFIEHFTASHSAWAHLDIAGTAFGDSEFAQSKTGTGFGIRLLVEFMERWTRDQSPS
jgi:leucyl aminopeptidase